MKRVGIDEKERIKDRFVDFGFGVVAFFKLLRTLIKTFAFISVFIALPQILTYRYFNETRDASLKEMTMLANTGVSSAQRYLLPISGTVDLNIECPANSYISSEYFMGIVPFLSFEQFYQRTTAYRNELLENDSYYSKYEEEPCPGVIRKQWFDEAFAKNCLNLTNPYRTCQISGLGGFVDDVQLSPE